MNAVSRRRDWLQTLFGHAATGVLGVGIADLLSSPAAAQWQPGRSETHFPARAKRVLHIFCPGAASHMDLWEHKPELDRNDGKPLPGAEEFVSFQGKNGNLMKSPWPFEPRGETGKMWSTLLPHMAQHVDDIAFVHSMTSKTNTHGPGCIFMNTGHVTEGFPSAGAWTSYALGSANENLPTYVAIADIRGEPPNGKANWSNGFLPARHQAITLAAHQPVRNLAPPASLPQATDEATRAFLARLNARHAAAHPENTELQARVAAYELAARMQLSAPEVMDLSDESESAHRLYATDDPNKLKAAYGRNCMVARRLLERGVRYVDLYCASRASGVDGLLNWDAHRTLKTDYERHCPIFDQPTAALLADLKQRGLLEDTLVIWTTEFGRMPSSQGSLGRDHNPYCFTNWLCGGGIRGGVSYGPSDEWGYKPLDRSSPTQVYDIHATLLYLLGIDHTRLTVRHNGIDRRLTDVHGHVIRDLLA